MTGYGYPPTLQRIIDLLRRVPGVGFKSAQRIAFHLLKMDPQQVRLLGEGILELREKISYCGRCNSLSESDPCPLMLFPFTRQIVCQAAVDGGFMPFLMEPINFIALYDNAQQKEQEN